MRVIVTGAQGQLGSAMVAAVPDGVEVVASARTDMDLADQSAVSRALERIRPDWIVNCAAYTDVDGAETDGATAMSVNADAVKIFADYCRAANARLMQVSTDCVFDGRSGRAYRPDDERGPISMYGRSKSLGEDAAGADAAIVRVSWLYDAGHSNFVTRMVELMRDRDVLKVVDDQRGSPGYVPEIVRAMWLLIEAGKDGTLHLCDRGVVSRWEWAVAIAEEAVRLGVIERAPEIVPVPSEQFPTLANRPANSALDTTSAQDAINWKPSDWRDNLARMMKRQYAHG